MAGRKYRMSKRAEAVDATRDRIVEATMALHLEQGVTATSHADIAARAGVGAATVYRHFPTLGALVEACGVRTWEIVQPPRPGDAGEIFAGLQTRRERLERLVAELAAFYERGARSLAVAQQDRERVPELDAGLREVEAGIAALVGAAAGDGASEDGLRVARALTELPAWAALKRHGVPPEAVVRLLECALDGTAVTN